ncbi:septal ring lytic transglycosylase RlpA family protein [Pseudohalioglobus sediminis]|uniref:Endolytic peptidoglycan transglycosylase RlpA n=1 Tax=Pseudohalioglobus sediminis TaxID=2606449 RepID=A0A5B0WN86_9GAMM|nr:septal ring lytic transglycosylase RlpA family protein [Pseudohalioglobus sediminis]KAA1188524.1 septal ring lytic transglycosylase RlpA family protein [Pseudohalioglobus sediminis]
MIRLALLAAGLALVLLGCGAPAPKSGDEYQATRYSQQQDAAPLQSISAADVADAVPRADPILLAGNKSPYTVNGVTYEILEDYRNYKEQGLASWYGSKFHGHETSNGEIFDLYAASAAHKTLPIPCYARVTNLDNGRSVVVRVNDRGPFHSDRLIDLSYAAAVKLGFMENGTAPVEVAVLNIAGVDDRRSAPGTHYRYLQLGAFSRASAAESLQADLQGFLQVPVFVNEVDAQGRLLYRVRVGPMADTEELELVKQQLHDGGYPPGQPLP